MSNFLKTQLDRRQCQTVLLGAVASAISPWAFGQEAASKKDADKNDAEVNGPDAVSTEGSTAATHLTFESPQIQRWRIGLVLETPVTCSNAFATFPVPTAWPEQKVRVVAQNQDPAVSGWKTRDLPGGAKQVLLEMPYVTAGQTVELTFIFEIERSRILGPADTSQLKIPARPDKDLKLYLGDSPFIDASNGRIKKASQEIAAMEAESDWQKVENIYDYVRDHVEYVESELGKASLALSEGKSDCEGMTSLFIALCRNARVPARMVWIPDHCYPEFYLEDAEGKGTWFPCQAAGTRQFGRMDEYRPVLQKGDRFKVPEDKAPVRYVSEFFRCDKKGKSNPKPKFVREQLDLE
jgi:Transglutaminase-like superfamily